MDKPNGLLISGGPATVTGTVGVPGNTTSVVSVGGIGVPPIITGVAVVVSGEGTSVGKLTVEAILGVAVGGTGVV